MPGRKIDQSSTDLNLQNSPLALERSTGESEIQCFIGGQTEWSSSEIPP